MYNKEEDGKSVEYEEDKRDEESNEDLDEEEEKSAERTERKKEKLENPKEEKEKNSKEESDEEETEKEETEDLGIAEGLKGGIGAIDTSSLATSSAEDLNLEDIAEQPFQQGIGEESSFSEFLASSGEMPTATLSTSDTSPSFQEPQQPDNLEQIGASSSIGTPIPSSSETARRERDYITVYNQPDYTGSRGSEESVFRDMRERGMVTRTIEEMRNVQPRIIMDDWHEAGMTESRSAGENLRDYVVVEPGRKEDIESRGLPFEQKTKYRELRKGRRETKGY